MAVNVEIGARTTGFSKGLAKMENEWAGFKGKLGRKFSFAEVGKGLMMGAGIGSFQQIASTLEGAFQAAADAAKLLEERTRDTLNMTLRLINLRSTPAQQITNTERELKGHRQLIEMQKEAVKNADKGAWLHISPIAMANFKAANDELTQMLAKEGDLIVAIEAVKIAEKNQREQAALNVEKAKEATKLAQLRGIVADPLARAGLGGGVYAPGRNSAGTLANPAQALLGESRKQTKSLKIIEIEITRRTPVSDTVTLF